MSFAFVFAHLFFLLFFLLERRTSGVVVRVLSRYQVAKLLLATISLIAR